MILKIIFNLDLMIVIFSSSYDNALRWIPWGHMDETSTLVQGMNGLVPSENKLDNITWAKVDPIYFTIWHHRAAMSYLKMMLLWLKILWILSSRELTISQCWFNYLIFMEPALQFLCSLLDWVMINYALKIGDIIVQLTLFECDAKVLIQ